MAMTSRMIPMIRSTTVSFECGFVVNVGYTWVRRRVLHRGGAGVGNEDLANARRDGPDRR